MYRVQSVYVYTGWSSISDLKYGFTLYSPESICAKMFKFAPISIQGQSQRCVRSPVVTKSRDEALFAMPHHTLPLCVLQRQFRTLPILGASPRYIHIHKVHTQFHSLQATVASDVKMVFLTFLVHV